MDQPKIDEAVIARIQKLFSLAQSDNEHEARAAAEKAQALLVKYNLDAQEVKHKDFEYLEQQVASEPYLRWHQPFIIDILQEFFFVKVIWYNRVAGYAHRDPNRYHDGYARKFRKDIVLFGTKTNVKIAHYVFDYLSQVYQRLWLEYKRENGLGEKSRKSYYQGLTNGLTVKLYTIRQSVQQERGLVLVKDPKLDERTKKVKSHHNPYKHEEDPDAEDAGFEAGQEIQISKPIEHKEGYSGKVLAASKKKG